MLATINLSALAKKVLSEGRGFKNKKIQGLDVTLVDYTPTNAMALS